VEDVQRATHTRDNPFSGLVIKAGLDLTSGERFDSPVGFILSKDANTDSEGLDWILSPNSGSEVDSLFTDLVHSRAKEIASGKAPAQISSRFGEAQKNLAIDSTIQDEEKNREVLDSLREEYGQEKLEAMSDREFFELYRNSV